VGYDDHSFSYLSSVLGKPVRTFSYTHRTQPTVDEHRWSCGCTAREERGHCALAPCAAHRALNRPRDGRIVLG
jgi:hypothetical protein